MLENFPYFVELIIRTTFSLVVVLALVKLGFDIIKKS
jgi:hypothetical protein